MAETHPLFDLIVLCSILLAMFGFSAYVDWDVKRKTRRKLAEMEREREASHAYWAPRIAAAQARQKTRQTVPASVAQLPPEPHNPGRRRILKSE